MNLLHKATNSLLKCNLITKLKLLVNLYQDKITICLIYEFEAKFAMSHKELQSCEITRI